MKLQDLAQPKKTKQIAKVFESYFGNRMLVEKLTKNQAQGILQRVRSLITEHRQTTDRHFAEQNPTYLKLVMMEQALTTHLAEIEVPAPAAASTGSTAKPAQPQIDPNKLKAAQDKLSKGQTLSSDEQKLINAQAAAQQQMQEDRLRRAFRTLKESEVQQAQVVLAAQDMVDSMQGMIEDATEMQYKELPALVDSIRNQIGMEQANQFNTDATSALTTLVQSLQGCKQQLETALGVVTGQSQPAPALDAAMAGTPAPTEPGAEMDTEPDTELGAEEPGAEEPEAIGTPGALGRGRR